jgi:hypothetical protein
MAAHEVANPHVRDDEDWRSCHIFSDTLACEVQFIPNELNNSSFLRALLSG